VPSVSSIGESLPPRLRWFVVATIATGAPVAAAAAAVCAQAHPGPHTILGIATFFALAILTEWRPVPIDVEGKRLVSLAFVFIISSRLLFGWEWSVLIATLAIGLALSLEHVEPIKIAFNSATYAIAVGVAALPAWVVPGVPHDNYGLVALSVVVAGAIFLLTNVLLVCIAISRTTGNRLREVFVDHIQHSGPVFVIAVFVTAQAVILWRLSAPLVLLLSAPLFALTLYQRSSVRGRVAEKAASTDSLTLLKNRRAFEEDAARLLHGEGAGASGALCLIDIDRFKQVNDRYGHPTGDAILDWLARALDESAPGRAYRIGGDEFAMLLEISDHAGVLAAAQDRFATRQNQCPDLREEVTISAGVAFFPQHGSDLGSLQKHADMALYQSKYNGRAKVSIYGDDTLPDGSGAATGDLALLLSDGRLATAHRLATLVDALADASARERGLLSTGSFSDLLDRWRDLNRQHSRAVANLAVALARRLGVDGEDLEHIHIAALLHDIGKIVLPDRFLNKPDTLSADERTLVERHPVVGYELLRGLGIGKAAAFVLHHHERWDGAGYPARLAGAEIPFGSRIILVADAFDALTSDRVYRRAVSLEAAIHELQSESGRQFDPLVVSALHEHFAHPAPQEEDLPTLEAAWSLSTSS